MVYCTSLENWRCASIPGFESQSLRFGGKTINIGAFLLILSSFRGIEDTDDLVKNDDLSDIVVIAVCFLSLSIMFLIGVLYITFR